MPGNLNGNDLEEFARNAASTYWHQTCTAKMGRDAMSVVDGNLKVYGIENLRIVDGSIMPRITTGNTMVPCIIIQQKAGRRHHDSSDLVSHANLRYDDISSKPIGNSRLDLPPLKRRNPSRSCDLWPRA